MIKRNYKKRGKNARTRVNVKSNIVLPEKKSNKFNTFLAFVLVFLIIFSLFGFMLSYYQESRKENINYIINTPRFVSFDNVTLISIEIPAIDDKGNGITTSLVIEAMSGSGRTMVDIDNLLFWADTQQSIRISRLVAANITKLNISNYDLVYNIYAQATVIGGGSAGAVITIATIAALQNKRLREDVMMTGSINHDGSIGPVSEIIAKAKAAKDSGATLLLVPLLQSRDVIYETREHCETFGPTKICSIEQLPKKIDVANETGIAVEEVGSIEEALKYFLAD